MDDHEKIIEILIPISCQSITETAKLTIPRHLNYSKITPFDQRKEDKNNVMSSHFEGSIDPDLERPDGRCAHVT